MQSAAVLTRSGRIARAAVLGLLAYWLVYCLVATANVIDAQAYEQARLYVIRQGGLFHNEIFHTPEQITFPWTFDAVHWPFLQLGFAHSLPAWLCLVGTMVIVWQLVREELDADSAWFTCLVLLAMPSMVYQATSTKNDFPMIFGVFCWYYALRRYRRDGRRIDLVASATAAAFAGGVKISGLLFVPLMVLASVWMLRHDRRRLVGWLACMTVAGVLLLSVETYVASWMIFGHWLGPMDGYVMFRNLDGVPGAIANAIRFAFLNVDTGTDVIFRHKSWLTALMEQWCVAVLGALDLVERGWMSFTAPVLDLRRSGHETTAGYGPIGTLAILSVPLAIARWKPREWPWRLAVAALATFSLVCLNVGWEVYGNRRLVLPFALAALAATLLTHSLWRSSTAARAAFLSLLLYGAVFLPLATSFNRKPQDLPLWITQRDRMTTREHAYMLGPVRKVRQLAEACPESPWVVTAAPFSWELVFYEILGDRAVIQTRQWITPETLEALRQRSPDRPVYLLTIQQQLRALPGVTEVQSFARLLPDRSRSWTRIYRYGPSRCGRAAADAPA